MQELLKRAEEVAALNKKRTQGEWKAWPWNEVQGNEDCKDWYINNIVDGMAQDVMTEHDAKFLVAAPRMAELIKDMAEILTLVKEFIEELESANPAVTIGALGWNKNYLELRKLLKEKE